VVSSIWAKARAALCFWPRGIRSGKVIGVELYEHLTTIAWRNIVACCARLRCRDIELVTTGVLNYSIPDDVSLVYMYNPFRGPIFDAAIANLVASVDRRPRPVRLIYWNATNEHRLPSKGRFKLVRTLPGLRPSREWRDTITLRVYELGPRHE
jgi:hypothetical protein